MIVQYIKALRILVWFIFIVGTLFVFMVAQSSGFHLYEVLDFAMIPTITLFMLPPFILFFASNKFAPDDKNRKAKLIVLIVYFLIALCVLGLMFNALMNV